jgi:putative heme-binding domain-containing protein
MLRLEALGALSESRKALKDLHFRWLVDQLGNKNEAPLRLKAAAVMAESSLTEKQILHLATGYLPTADAFILARLVPVFKGGYSSEIGKALLSTLLNSDVLDSYTEENILSVFGQYPDDLKPDVDKLIAKLNAAHGERFERIQRMESQIEGGVLENGRRLFFGKAVCSTCHTIGPEGGTLGPDLTSIQRDRSAHDLLEAIVYPSLSYVREYETYHIKTHDEEYIGIIQQQTAGEVVVGTAPETSVRIPRSKILSMEISDISLMPQGLDKLLTEQEMADLMAFLVGQDQDPKMDESILR